MKESESSRKYHAHETLPLEGILPSYGRTEAELKDLTAYLIQYRELMRDVELIVSMGSRTIRMIARGKREAPPKRG